MSEHPFPLVIAIDGPAASGKSTLARVLSNLLGFALLPTGILYRKAALLVLKNHLNLNKTEALEDIAQQLCDDQNLFQETPEIYKNDVSRVASQVAMFPGVRRRFLSCYRTFILHPPNKEPGIVIEGRDSATVIAPDSDVKIFLTALLEIRTQRRYQDLQKQQSAIDFDTVLNEIKARDENDLQRNIAPLVPAEDSIILDTSKLFGIQRVLDVVVNLLNTKPSFLPYTSYKRRMASL